MHVHVISTIDLRSLQTSVFRILIKKLRLFKSLGELAFYFIYLLTVDVIYFTL